jgi:acyl-coenzyme A synthetase/AMP-(fatty) acid ligase
MSTITLEDLAKQALARDPAQPIIEWEDKWITWGDYKKVADQVYAIVDATGVAPRAPVAVIPRNRPSAPGAILPLVARGHQIIMIHPYQSPAGLARDIAKVKPAIAVAAAEDFTDEVRAALKEHGIAGIAMSDVDGKMSASAVSGCEKSTAKTAAPLRQFDLLTSGTTGHPKHFPLAFDTIAKNMIASNMMNMDDGVKAPPMLLFYPFGNFSGLYSNLPPIMNGIRCVLIDRFNFDKWLAFVKKYKPSFLGVPTAAIQMILERNVPKEDFKDVKWLNTGASTLDVSVQRQFEERYGIPILIAYGATEFGGPVTAMTQDIYPEWGKKKVGSVGRAWAGAQLRVVHPETGAILPPNTEGLLEVVSPRIGPNWIRTSDVVVIDDDGFMWHKGRADGAIMRGGFKVLPDTIEKALVLHDAVSAAGVTAVPDKRLGQVPAVAIQLKPGVAKPTVADLEKHLRQQVEATHIPTIWRFVDTLPYTPMSKVDRAALKKMFETVDA